MILACSRYSGDSQTITPSDGLLLNQKLCKQNVLRIAFSSLIYLLINWLYINTTVLFDFEILKYDCVKFLEANGQLK